MRNIHMMGIGGIGMSAIARLLIERGDNVTGCDARLNPITNKLNDMGVDVSCGHSPAHINDSIEIIVHTSAVKNDHPELIEAKKHSIPVMRRAQILADIVKEKSVTAVTGTHGKTTTSFMITHIMNYAGLNPGFAIGGEMEELGGNARWSNGKYFVLEADESDGTQVYLKPDIAVITNIDCDHMEYYSDVAHIARIMKEFTDKMPPNGLIIGCGDDIEINKILKDNKTQNINYGFDRENNIYAADLELRSRNSIFNVWYKRKLLGKINLSIPGRHNVLNAMAGIGVCMHIGIPFNQIAGALNTYPGVKRRLDIVFKDKDITVIDDYAHHPREIKAVVDTVSKMSDGRCIGVFQPHRYTRTKLLAGEFGNCFNGLDKLILTDIYPAGETPIKGVTGKLIYDEVVKFGKTDTVYIESKNDILKYLMPNLISGDTLVFMGAGDITGLAHSFSSYSTNCHAATK